MNLEVPFVDKELLKGSIDILLLSLLSEKDSYGYEMTKEIRKKSDEAYSMNEGTLYPALKRLEAKGFVTSYWHQELEASRRKYYSITEDGRKELGKKLKNWNKISDLIHKFSEGYS
ncbi:Transcriptional regulator, PadR family protein [Bacillus sp. NRRL B-14911]|nr:PadR family transcriptional regulator [Bacillus infantis]EAR64947.1 Transcriptional regulator, PadR family protein [Bacillus sp. NRRL B-14911]OXT15757.1 PadR family transcriptional regulator [Bacillus sp. OG2]